MNYLPKFITEKMPNVDDQLYDYLVWSYCVMVGHLGDKQAAAKYEKLESQLNGEQVKHAMTEWDKEVVLFIASKSETLMHQREVALLRINKEMEVELQALRIQCEDLTRKLTDFQKDQQGRIVYNINIHNPIFEMRDHNNVLCFMDNLSNTDLTGNREPEKLGT